MKPISKLGLVLTCGLLAMLFFVVASWAPLQTFGHPWMLSLSSLGVFVWMIVVVASGITLLGCIPRKTRKRRFTTFLCLASVSMFSVFGLRIGRNIRINQFNKLGDRSHLLITSMNDFIAQNGSCPSELNQLVPDFLPTVPNTGMGAYPDYELILKKEGRELYGNDWIIKVPCSIGMLNWDEFLYFPNSNYPDHAFGGYLESIGDWAYVHE